MSTKTSTDTELENERPLRADARRNRERIIEAARELFAGERPNVQMDEVAHRAGVGVGTVYRHFSDKEALMGELVRQRFDLFNENLRQALAGELRDDFQASDIPMVMCGICATIDVSKPGWDWQRHLTLILHGMHA
jgi:AcrR family transcriptional regulator